MRNRGRAIYKERERFTREVGKPTWAQMKESGAYATFPSACGCLFTVDIKGEAAGGTRASCTRRCWGSDHDLVSCGVWPRPMRKDFCNLVLRSDALLGCSCQFRGDEASDIITLWGSNNRRSIRSGTKMPRIW